MKETHKHHFDSFYEIFQPYNAWAGHDLNQDNQVDINDWYVYKNQHLHHALDGRIWNLFYEEFWTWDYVLHSYNNYDNVISTFQALIDEIGLPTTQAEMGTWLG